MNSKPPTEGEMKGVPSPEQLQKAMLSGDWSGLQVKPKPSCKCMGRGYSGRNILTGSYMPCKCILKQLDKPFKIKLGGK